MPKGSKAMQLNRWLLLAVMGGLLASCAPTPVKPVELPVSKQPPRAMNEELIELPFAERPAPASKPAVAVKETAVAQTPAAGAEKPTDVAVTAKPQAEPGTQPATMAVAATNPA